MSRIMLSRGVELRTGGRADLFIQELECHNTSLSRGAVSLVLLKYLDGTPPGLSNGFFGQF